MHRSVRSLAIAVLGLLTLAACAGTPAAIVAPSASVVPSPSASEAPTPRASAEASPSPSPTPRPSPTPTPEPSPSPEPSPTPTPAIRSAEPTHAAGVEAGFLAKTATADLRIRSKPGLGTDSEKLEPLLQEGDRLRVLAGPVEADGYDWFLVDPRVYDEETGRGYPDGWVAAGKNGEPWLKPLRLECPSVPTGLDGMRNLASDYWLPCFGGVEITFNARLEQTGYRCTSPDGIQGAMFGGCAAEFDTGLVALNAIHRLGVVWGPDVDLSIAARPAAPPEEWPTVEVTGQFDHPAATTCEADTAEDTTELAAEIHQARAVLACRNAFVVTSMRMVDA